MATKVLLDANVLFRALIRDTLLRAGEAGLLQVHWSPEILDETGKSLAENKKLTPKQVESLLRAIKRAFPESMVTGYEKHAAKIENDPKDRHVVAAAIEANAEAIVTYNLKHFDLLPRGIVAVAPDEVLCEIWLSNQDAMLDLLREQAAALVKPKVSFADFLNGLRKDAPKLADLVKAGTREEES